MAPRKKPLEDEGATTNDGHRKKMSKSEVEREERIFEKQESVSLPSMEDTVTVVGVDDDAQSDVSKAIKTLIGSDLRTSTELSIEEIQDLTVLLEIAEKYKCKRIDMFCKNYMALKVSLNRGSRKEVVAAFSGMEGMSHRGQQDMFSRFRGVQ